MNPAEVQEDAEGQEDSDACMAEGPDEVDRELEAAQAERSPCSYSTNQRGWYLISSKHRQEAWDRTGGQ